MNKLASFISIYWRRRWHPTPVLLPGKSMDGGAWWAAVHGVATDTTERLHFHFSLSCIGEGNGNPLQCSCLETPGVRSLVGCPLRGRTESDTTEGLSSSSGGISIYIALLLLLLSSPSVVSKNSSTYLPNSMFLNYTEQVGSNCLQLIKVCIL